MPLDALRTFNRFELKYIVTKRDVDRLRDGDRRLHGARRRTPT